MRKILSIVAIVALVVCASCASVQTGGKAEVKKDESRKENVVSSTWKKLNPLYNSEWSPWKKFIYWVGPGH